MPTVPRLPRRLRYRSIASEEEEEEAAATANEDDSNRRNERRNQREREENHVNNNNDDKEEKDEEDEETSSMEEDKQRNRTNEVQTPLLESSSNSSSNSSLIQVIILDFCQTRFTVTTSPTTTIADFKVQGYAVHKVPPHQQRLIYQGRMLNETSTNSNATPKRLCDYGIKANGTIVHLFPKPRVVVVPDGSSSSSAAAAMSAETDEEMAHTTTTTTNNNNTSARVPTIVLSNEEAEQRGQILVLGNLDYLEAVNNVKLFSFMLLIVSTIELLNLLSILMGENGDYSYGRTDNTTSFNNNMSDHNHHPYIQPEDDDLFHDDISFPPGPPDRSHPTNYSSAFNSTSSSGNSLYPEDPAAAIYQTWSTLSWLDLIVSTFGVYVAVLGLRASNDNRLSMARLYLMGLVITAIGWLGYNYMITVQVDEAVAESIHTSSSETDDDEEEDDVYGQAFQVMVLPAMIWCLCIFRAWQFQYLLSEAELEAAERIAQHEAAAAAEHHSQETITTTTTDEHRNHPSHHDDESQSHTNRTTQNPSTWIRNGVLS
jgi:hypothetical protein